MRIETTRFGVVEAAEDEIIRFRAGLIGFPAEKEYVLIPHGSSSMIAWLQSVTTPELAFPVASAHGFVADYPDIPLEPILRRADIGDALDDIAILAVLSAPRNQPATVNLLAPLVVSSRTREGAQIFLEGSRFSTRELFVVPRQSPAATDDSDGEAPLAEAAVG